MTDLVWESNKDDKRVGIRFSETPHPLEIVGTGQAKLALQENAYKLLLPLAVPICALDVIVFLDSQSIASF
jgi:hypothetical protein